jgi:hypothetical protein
MATNGFNGSNAPAGFETKLFINNEVRYRVKMDAPLLNLAVC